MLQWYSPSALSNDVLLNLCEATPPSISACCSVRLLRHLPEHCLASCHLPAVCTAAKLPCLTAAWQQQMGTCSCPKLWRPQLQARHQFSPESAADWRLDLRWSRLRIDVRSCLPKAPCMWTQALACRHCEASSRAWPCMASTLRTRDPRCCSAFARAAHSWASFRRAAACSSLLCSSLRRCACSCRCCTACAHQPVCCVAYFCQACILGCQVQTLAHASEVQERTLLPLLHSLCARMSRQGMCVCKACPQLSRSLSMPGAQGAELCQRTQACHLIPPSCEKNFSYLLQRLLGLSPALLQASHSILELHQICSSFQQGLHHRLGLHVPQHIISTRRCISPSFSVHQQSHTGPTVTPLP